MIKIKTLSVFQPYNQNPYPNLAHFSFCKQKFQSFPQKTKPLLLSSHHGDGFKTWAKRGKEMILGTPTVFVERGKYSYEVTTLINKLSSLPPRGSMARCLEPIKNKLSLNDFALVFKEFAQRGDWQRSLRLFKYMQRQIWCKPNEQLYTIVIGVLGREGLLEKAHEVFDDMSVHQVPRTVYSYTSLINAYARNGKFETALQLLARMKMERVAPSVLTYNTVINSCARGGLAWEELLGLFAEMRHEGVLPDIVTYNTLLSACNSRGLGDEAEMVFRNMNESGVLPDFTTYRYIVETFQKLGKLEKVCELLKDMEMSGNVPDVSTYNLLLEAYAKLGSIKDCLVVFRQMQEAGCMPNASTYSTLLNLYGNQGRYDDVRDLFLEMKVSNTEPDANTYNILIQVFGEGGYFKEVVTLFHDLVEENVDPDMETYEGLIYSCGKGGLYKDAEDILLHMNENGIVPSPKVYSGVIEAYGQAALYEEAIVAYNTMNEVGSKPDLETYNSLINAFAKGGLFKEIGVTLNRIDESGIPRNLDTYNAVIEGYRQGGQYEDALKAYSEMEAAKCDPDEQTLEAILSIYYFASLVEEAEEQFEEIKALGILPSVMCYCMMIALYAKTYRTNKAFELLSEMLNYKKSNIHQMIAQLIEGDFDDESNWQMVEYIFDKLHSEGCAFGMRFFNILLEALWWLGQKERAARVLNEATKRGLFPELFRYTKMVWSLDVHRLWPGGACTAVSVWLNEMLNKFIDKTSLPQLASLVIVRGEQEKSSATTDFPVAKVAYTFLKDNIPSSYFSLADWNEGRFICKNTQLKRLLKEVEKPSDDSKKPEVIELSNAPLPLLVPKNSTTTIRIDQHRGTDSAEESRRKKELTPI